MYDKDKQAEKHRHDIGHLNDRASSDILSYHPYPPISAPPIYAAVRKGTNGKEDLLV